MCKFNQENPLLIVLLSTLLTSLNAFALEEKPAPEALINTANYINVRTTADGQRIVLMQVEKSEYAHRIEITGNDLNWYRLPESWQVKGNVYSVVLAPQAQSITIKATGKSVKQRVKPRLVWDWGLESKQICTNLPWWLGGHRCITTRLPTFVSKLIPGYHTVFKYKDQVIQLSLAERMTEMGDISLSVNRKSGTEQLVITSQFEPVTNAKSYQQECTSDDGRTISASKTEFDANSLSVTVDHYGRSYRCALNATIKSSRDIFKDFVKAHRKFPDLIDTLDMLYQWLDTQDTPSFMDKFLDELPSYMRDGSEATLVSVEQVIDVPVQHRYAFNQGADQEHYAYHAYPTQASFEEALAEAQFCHSAWCLVLGNGDTFVLYGDYNLPVDQDDQASNGHAYTYTLYLANFDDEQTTPQVLHQISSPKQLAKLMLLDAQPMPDTNVYSVLLSYRDKNVADMVHITENLDEREEGSLATIYSATSTHIAPIDSNDTILAMPVLDVQADLGQTLLATYNPQTELLSVQGYDHHGNLIESDYITGAVGDLALPLDRLWIDHHNTTQDTAEDSTENTPLRSLNIVDNHGTYTRFTDAENALYTSQLIDINDANSKPLIQLTTSGEQCKNYYLDEVEDETRFVAYPDCMLADHAYMSANNQKLTYLSSSNNSHNHQLACYQDNDAATADATTEKVHCHRHHPIVGLYHPALDFGVLETKSFRLDNTMLKTNPDTSSAIGKYPTHIQEINIKSNNDKLMVAFSPTARSFNDISWNVFRDGFILKQGEKYFGSSLPFSDPEVNQIEFILDLIGYSKNNYIRLPPGNREKEKVKSTLNNLGNELSQSDHFQDVHVVNSHITGSQLFSYLIEDIKYTNVDQAYIDYSLIMNGQYRQGITMSEPDIWSMENNTYIYRIPFCTAGDCYNKYSAYIQINGHDNKVAFDQLMPRYKIDRTLPPSNIALNLDGNKILILQVGRDVQVIEKHLNAEGTFNYITTVARGNNAGVKTRIIDATDHQYASVESLFNNLSSSSQASGLDEQLLEQIESLYVPVNAKVLLAEWFSAISTQQAFPITHSSQLWSKTANMISERLGTNITELDDADSAIRLNNQLMAIAQLIGLSMPELNSHFSSLDGATFFDEQLLTNLKAEVNNLKQAIGLTDEVAQIIERAIKEQWELARSASEQKIDTITAGLEDSIAGLYLPEGSDSDYKFYQLSEGNDETIKDIIAIERTEKSIEWVVVREGRLPSVSLRIDRNSESQRNKLDLWINGKPFQIAPLVYKYTDQAIVSSLGSLLSRLQDFIDIAAENNASNGQLTDKFNQLDRQVLLSYRAVFCPPTPTSTSHGPVVGEGEGNGNENDEDNNDENRDSDGYDIGIPNENNICQTDLADIELMPNFDTYRQLNPLNEQQVVDQLNQRQEQQQEQQQDQEQEQEQQQDQQQEQVRQQGQQIGQRIIELFEQHLDLNGVRRDSVRDAVLEINPENRDQIDDWFALIRYSYNAEEDQVGDGSDPISSSFPLTEMQFRDFVSDEQIRALEHRAPLIYTLVQNEHWRHNVYIDCDNFPSCFERFVGRMRTEMARCRSITCGDLRTFLAFNTGNLPALILALAGRYKEAAEGSLIVAALYFSAFCGRACPHADVHLLGSCCFALLTAVVMAALI